MNDDMAWLKKRPAKGPARSLQTHRRTNEQERCPKGHAMWHLYHKKIEGTPDTIVCCRKCDEG